VLTPMMLELGVAPAVSVASTQVRHTSLIIFLAFDNEQCAMGHSAALTTWQFCPVRASTSLFVVDINLRHLWLSHWQPCLVWCACQTLCIVSHHGML
jgi:hypothetical protein